MENVDAVETELIVDAVRRALANLKFGSIEITVHDAKVVQIERREKIRFKSNGGKP